MIIWLWNVIDLLILFVKGSFFKINKQHKQNINWKRFAYMIHISIKKAARIASGFPDSGGFAHTIMDTYTIETSKIKMVT